jgi:hypothetical protein
MQYKIANSNNRQNNDINNVYTYYADSTLNNVVSDSLSHLITKRTNNKTSYQTILTYSEPVSTSSSLEFSSQITRNVYGNTAVTDTVLANGQLQQLTRFDNIYRYVFTESRISVNYRYTSIKFAMSIGGRVVPYNLSGTRTDNSGADIHTSHSNFRIIPIVDLGYSWSRSERISLKYTGTNMEPLFNQIQPFTDKADPNNIVVGNPNLRPSFSNAIDLIYNKYLPNARMNISLNVNDTYIQDAVQSNILQTVQTIVNNGIITYKTVNEIHYVNLNGANTIEGRYNISRQMANRRYYLSLNGNVSYTYGVGMSNNDLYHTANWRFNERFGPRINPNDKIEINPYIGYDLSRNFNTLQNATQTMVQTTSLAIDGKMYLGETLQINYSATKSYVTGYSNLGNPSPFVLNAGFEKMFFQKKSMVLTFNIYDILHQNNFIQQTFTTNGYTNMVSNTLSRYFLLGLRLNLQKWNGRPTRRGKTLNRRGDGSFIY